MKKIIVAVAAVGTLVGLGACERKPSDRLDHARADVAEKQRDLNETRQDKANDVAEARAEAGHDLAKTQQDVNEELNDKQQHEADRLADARKNYDEKVTDAQQDANHDVAAQQQDLAKSEQKLNEAEAETGVGGSGALAMQSTRGTVTKLSSDSLTLKEPDGKTRTFDVSGNTQYFLPDEGGKLTDLRVGSRVFASYKLVDEKPTMVRVDLARQ